MTRVGLEIEQNLVWAFTHCNGVISRIQRNPEDLAATFHPLKAEKTEIPQNTAQLQIVRRY
ncbi:hypothetical protein GCM10009069_12550 [Algimonas arctica]|uniref:Uncharacterized protein n=1 Tax=Algimonas arctica TaxID=1479486 RepID=A0A8J3CRJ7_9PROT|nr:hypothetical protein GCM10009069_12550 [Algimonas arctica]